MKITELTTRLAYIFGEELFIKIGEKHVKNPKLTGLYEYLIFKFNEDTEQKKIKNFFKYTIENFKPTQAERFPCVATIKQFYIDFLDTTEIVENKYIPFDERDMNTAFGNIHKVTYEPPEGKEDSSLQERLEDYKVLSDDEMLKKYGIRLTSEVWIYEYEIQKKKKEMWEEFD